MQENIVCSRRKPSVDHSRSAGGDIKWRLCHYAGMAVARNGVPPERTFAFAIGGWSMRFLVGAIVALAVDGCAAGTPSVTAPPAVTIDIDIDGAAVRLADAIRIQTISAEPDTARRDAAFRALHELLARYFPAVAGALRPEAVNGSSLLYTWPGSDPTAKPILLMAHMDVVPVEAGTEGDWRHAAFTGMIDEAEAW